MFNQNKGIAVGTLVDAGFNDGEAFDAVPHFSRSHILAIVPLHTVLAFGNS